MTDAQKKYHARGVQWAVEGDQFGPALVYIEDDQRRVTFWPLAVFLDRADEIGNFERFAAAIDSGKIRLDGDDLELWKQRRMGRCLA